jgi:arylsulfatase
VETSAFTGQINRVELKVGEDDHTHLLDPQDHIHVLMARQ